MAVFAQLQMIPNCRFYPDLKDDQLALYNIKITLTIIEYCIYLTDHAADRELFWDQGATVWMPFLPIFTSEQHWQDAAAFRPERFLEEDADLAGPLPTPASMQHRQDASSPASSRCDAR